MAPPHINVDDLLQPSNFSAYQTRNDTFHYRESKSFQMHFDTESESDSIPHLPRGSRKRRNNRWKSVRLRRVDVDDFSDPYLSDQEGFDDIDHQQLAKLEPKLARLKAKLEQKELSLICRESQLKDREIQFEEREKALKDTPVEMSWRGKGPKSRYDPDLHDYGYGRNGERKTGKMFLKQLHLDPEEELYLCHDTYGRNDIACKYPKLVNGQRVQCAQNHDLSQEKLDEMFYHRRLTLTQVKEIVANSMSPTIRKDVTTLRVPVPPPQYDELQWQLWPTPSTVRYHFKKHEESLPKKYQDMSPRPLKIFDSGSPLAPDASNSASTDSDTW